MAALCVEGNCPPSEFLEVLEYDEAVYLAGLVVERRNKAEEQTVEMHKAFTEALLKSQGEVMKAIDNQTKNLARALGARMG